MDHKNSNQHASHHVVPIKVYLSTLIALLVLTVLTIGASYIDFGKGNIFVALGIASFKAALVMMFFMGLKYDNMLNRGAILSSFVFLGIFLWLTASDLWTRKSDKPVEVQQVAAALGMEDIKKMENSSPDLVQKGQQIFTMNCAVCHGPEGKGDGLAGAALNPKPRNYYDPSSKWTNGTSVKSIYVTLTYGVPNTGMASYKQLPPQDRLALVHFIRSKVPDPQTQGKADARYAAALKEDGIGEGAVAKKAGLPIPFVMDVMLKEKH